MELEKIKEAKQALERDLVRQLRDFEAMTEISVLSVNFMRETEIGAASGKIVAVDITAEV